VNVHLVELVQLELGHGRGTCQIFQDRFFQNQGL
jgi:hypothetical protein